MKIQWKKKQQEREENGRKMRSSSVGCTHFVIRKKIFFHAQLAYTVTQNFESLQLTAFLISVKGSSETIMSIV
jgi:hypothetical protein